MLDPGLEILRLRSSLINKGIDEYDVDNICDRVADELEQRISGIVTSAYQDALEAGVEMEADQFLAEVRPVQQGNTFQISTFSGKTDFSTPPFPMLPRLLASGKVSKKDGSIYKVIPMGGKSTNNKSGPRAGNFSIMDVMNSINQNRQNIKNKVRSNRKSGSTRYSKPNPWDGVNDSLAGITNNKSMPPNSFSGDTMAKTSPQQAHANQSIIDNMRSQSSGLEKQLSDIMSLQRGKKDNGRKAVSTGSVTFRTATSKQNASSSWVHPGKNMDMTGVMMDINTNLEQSIDSTIRNIVLEYERGY